MPRLTMDDILLKNGLDRALLHNPKFTKAVAAELKRRGFRQEMATQDGKRIRVWTDEAKPDFIIGEIVERALK